MLVRTSISDSNLSLMAEVYELAYSKKQSYAMSGMVFVMV